jgi:hypothetical protein
MGAAAYDIILNHNDNIQTGCILEIGACPLGPYGESSSTFFAGYIMNKPILKFYTIDRDVNIINSLKRFEKIMPGKFHAWCGDPLELIKNIHEPISFAYLDNFDYIPPDSENEPWIYDMKQRYLDIYGIELTNENSANVHLEQTKMVHERSAEKSYIVFDDTWEISTAQTFYNMVLPENSFDGWYGKGAKAIPWLLSNGWTLVEKDMEGRPRDDWTILRNW